MTLTEHLNELRNRFIVVAVFFIVCFICSYVFGSEKLLSYLIDIGKQMGYTLTYISPQEILLQELKISLYIGLFLSIPIAILEMLLFVFPAVDTVLGKVLLAFIFVCSFALFVGGAFFAYKVIIPLVYKTLYDIGNSVSAVNQVTTGNFVSLFFTFLFCLGLAFEMPVITIFLSVTGAVTPKLMFKGFRVAVVVIFIIAALITPPDVMSQIAVGIPMIALYLISIFISLIFQRKVSLKEEGE